VAVSDHGLAQPLEAAALAANPFPDLPRVGVVVPATADSDAAPRRAPAALSVLGAAGTRTALRRPVLRRRALLLSVAAGSELVVERRDRTQRWSRDRPMFLFEVA